MSQFYLQFIYQPFFNLLVGIYTLLEKIPGGSFTDMGIAVIIFTIALRILLLPLTLSSQRSEPERKQIEEAIKKIKIQYENNPVEEKRRTRKLFLQNKRVIFSEALNFSIQGIIFLMLYRIFSRGLLGADFHLLYDFMPQVTQPLNLVFLQKFDLSQPNITLNIIQSVVIFAVELISIFASPFPTSRKDIIRLQLILPVVSFLIFANFPAGKKLFIITTLSFSFLLILGQIIARFFRRRLAPSPTKKS